MGSSESTSGQLQAVRASAAAILFLLTMACGILPVAILRHWYKRKNTNKSISSAIANSRLVQLIMFFGGGVLIATAFCHLIPEAREQWDDYVKRSDLSGANFLGLAIGGGHEGGNTLGDPILEVAPLPPDSNATHHEENESDNHEHDDKDPHEHGHDRNISITSRSSSNDDKAGSEEDDHDDHDHEHGIPIVEIAICAGFFAIYLLEEAMHAIFGAHSHSAAEGEEDDSSETILVSRDHHAHHPHHRVAPAEVSSGGILAKRYSDPTGPSNLYQDCRSHFHAHPRHYHHHRHHGDFILSCYRSNDSAADLITAQQNIGIQRSSASPIEQDQHSCAHEGCVNLAVDVENSGAAGSSLEKRSIRSGSTNMTAIASPATSPLPPPPSLHPISSLATNSSNYGAVSPLPPPQPILNICDDQHSASSASSTSNESNSSSMRSIEPTWVRFVRGVLIIVAFSIHSVFDGVAIGLQETPNKVYVLLAAIFCHKSIIAVVLGMDLMTTTKSLWLTAANMALFSIMSPIGILIVIFAEDSAPGEGESAVLMILQALAIGTVLYIAFFEILQEDHSRASKSRVSGLLKWLAMLAGFIVMLLMLLFISHE